MPTLCGITGTDHVSYYIVPMIEVWRRSAPHLDSRAFEVERIVLKREPPDWPLIRELVPVVSFFVREHRMPIAVRRHVQGGHRVKRFMSAMQKMFSRRKST